MLRLLPPEVAAAVRVEAFHPPARSQGLLNRFGQDFLVAWRMVRRAARLGAHHLLLTCVFPGSLVGAKLALATLPARRRPRVDAVIHSVLEQVWGWRSRNPLRRLFDLTTALNLPAPAGFRVVVLEASIARDLAAQLPRVAPHLQVIAFPIVETVTPPPRRPGPPRVGFLGRATEEKGFDHFCQLAAAVRATGAAVEFHAVGYATAGTHPDEMLRALATPPATAPIPRGDFLARVADLDLVAMLHDTTHYGHTASGVLLDAIAAGRPVLTLSDAMVATLVTGEGQIGPQCRDLAEAAAWLASLTEADLEGPEFVAWRACVREVARSRHPVAVGSAYARTLRG
jgi:glycosyltransferase involved in cell wall biosynthesis